VAEEMSSAKNIQKEFNKKIKDDPSATSTLYESLTGKKGTFQWVSNHIPNEVRLWGSHFSDKAADLIFEDPQTSDLYLGETVKLLQSDSWDNLYKGIGQILVYYSIAQTNPEISKKIKGLFIVILGDKKMENVIDFQLFKIFISEYLRRAQNKKLHFTFVKSQFPRDTTEVSIVPLEYVFVTRGRPLANFKAPIELRELKKHFGSRGTTSALSWHGIHLPIKSAKGIKYAEARDLKQFIEKLNAAATLQAQKIFKTKREMKLNWIPDPDDRYLDRISSGIRQLTKHYKYNIDKIKTFPSPVGWTKSRSQNLSLLWSRDEIEIWQRQFKKGKK
jgi:hypothetical protein